MEIHKVGVVGCGLMGSGVAQVAATAGYPTVVHDVSQALLEKGLAAMERSLSKLVEKGEISPEMKTRALDHLTPTLRLEDFVECDLVIEAIVENLERKKELFAALDKIVKPAAILASNTSSLSITELMVATRRPAYVIGLHFFNPVPLMKLVEVVRTVVSKPEPVQMATDFARSLGKVPILTTDRAGFIVNRLLVPYLLDAVRALEERVGTIEAIDLGMKLGCNYPMGPFTLLDLVGIDTTYAIAEILFDEYREKRFAPPPLLRRMVLAGMLGRKSGKGFYDYSDPKNPQANKLLEMSG